MHKYGIKCHAYVENKTKLDARSEEGTFICYYPCSPAYLVYFKKNNTVRRERCVKFNDKQLPVEENFHEDDLVSRRKTHSEEEKPDSPQQKAHEVQRSTFEDVTAATDDQRRYPQRLHRRPKYLDDYIEGVTDVSNLIVDCCYKMQDIPMSNDEAMSSPDAHSWKLSMDKEILSLSDNTHVLMPCPKGHSIIRGKWVYNIKYGSYNEKTKTRYVARGFSQVKYIDYVETFSPTARMSSVRMILGLAVENGNIVHQMDFETAYLNADIDCELYLEQP
ncbi:Reverse transcriptase RNA-dependent DNA polymerase [Trinorchestia longiramus]|nr:Reverse transcriptase RNA-dependent DNA polymerase [Trinorchestia longiramus]